MRKVKLHFDGSCEPFNPGGNMGFGYLIKDEAGTVLFSGSDSEPMHPQNTNNVAEYRALCLGLVWLIENGYEDAQVEVFGDSTLVINQMNGEWRARGGLYFTDYRRAIELKSLFKTISFNWVRREFNTEADNLSKIAV